MSHTLDVVPSLIHKPDVVGVRLTGHELLLTFWAWLPVLCHAAPVTWHADWMGMGTSRIWMNLVLKSNKKGLAQCS